MKGKEKTQKYLMEKPLEGNVVQLSSGFCQEKGSPANLLEFRLPHIVFSGTVWDTGR